MASINGQLVQALSPAASTQAISISGTTASSTAISKKFVRLWATVDCFVAWGEAATTAKMPLGAFAPEYFPMNGSTTIQAITSSATGTLYVTEMN